MTDSTPTPAGFRFEPDPTVTTAWVGVGTPDLFLDEDREYARRLTEAGVEVTYVEVDGAIHGFDSLADSPLSRAFDASAIAFTRRFTV